MSHITIFSDEFEGDYVNPNRWRAYDWDRGEKNGIHLGDWKSFVYYVYYYMKKYGAFHDFNIRFGGTHQMSVNKTEKLS